VGQTILLEPEVGKELKSVFDIHKRRMSTVPPTMRGLPSKSIEFVM